MSDLSRFSLNSHIKPMFLHSSVILLLMLHGGKKRKRSYKDNAELVSTDVPLVFCFFTVFFWMQTEVGVEEYQ